MKRQNKSSKNRRSLRWIITAGSAAAVLGFWGIFSQAQNSFANVSGTQQNIDASSARLNAMGIPTLVPQIQSNVTMNSQSLINQARRVSPITITRSSR